MELEKLPKTNVKELTTSQKEDLFGNIIRGKDVTEEIETSRGKFKVKFPRIADLETIGRILAYRMNGLSVQSMDPNVYNLMQQIATLDVIVVSGPAWYENAKAEDNFTWSNCPIQSFIQEVYAKAYDFRSKVQNILESNKRNTNNGMAAIQSNDNADEPGLFKDLSGETGTSR